MLSHFRRLRREYPAVFFALLTLRLFVFALMLRKLLAHRFVHAGLCVLTLLLYEIPLFMRLLRIDTPPLFELVVALFATFANVFGEIFELYLSVPFWDSLLHITWGFLAAILSISFFDLHSGRGSLMDSLSPACLALLALSFAALTSVVWEIFEYSMDCIFLTDMQKDCYLSVVNSILLNPEGINVPVSEAVSSVSVNGTLWSGYIDVGLKDTMSDILYNTLGSLISSAVLYFGRRNGTELSLFLLLMPRMMPLRKDDIS